MDPLLFNISTRLDLEDIRHDFCGALRRGVPLAELETVKIDIVVDSIVDAWLIFNKRTEECRGPLPSSKRSSFNIAPKVSIALYLAYPEEWGAMVMAATGNQFFNIQLRAEAKRQGMRLGPYGLWHNENIIAGLTEEQIFDALGVRYYKPEERNFNRDSKLEMI